MEMKKILFNNKFDCTICLNGEIPAKEIFNKITNLPLLSADGVAVKLFNLGIESDKIIGDLDSIYEHDIPKFSQINEQKLVKIDDQDTNDFEKVLKYATEQNYLNCLVLGINGGELEHTLNNWSVLMKYSDKMNLCVYTQNRYGIVINKNITVTLKKDEIVSLIPACKAVVSSKNLNWELNNYLLEMGRSEGARNFVVSDNDVEIYLHEGKYFLFVESRLPFCFSYCD